VDAFELTLHLRLAGAVLVVLGLVHAALPRVLGWGGELAALSALNRQVSYVHCGFVGLTCALWGGLALTAGPELARPHPVTRALLTGAVVFWGSRLVVQLGLFNPAHACRSVPWLVLSVAGTVLWAWLTVVWAWALSLQFTAS
jgi:hypothetical protein